MLASALRAGVFAAALSSAAPFVRRPRRVAAAWAAWCAP
jgi:hypothetical protein